MFRSGGYLDCEDRVQRTGIVVNADVLSDLLFIHEALVEPADLIAAEDIRADVGERVGICIEWGRDPGHIQARQFDAILDDSPAFFGYRWRRYLHHGNVRPPFQT